MGEFDARSPIDLRASVFSSSSQSRTAVDAAPDGSLYAVWDSRRQEAGTYGVYARVFDALGRARSQEIRVNETATNMQQRPAVAAAADGSAWFVWESHGQDGSGTGVVARQFQPDAEAGLIPAGGEIAVNQVREGEQAQPVVAAHRDGAVLAVFASQRPSGDGAVQFELRARRLDQPGAAEVVLPAAEDFSDELPSVAATRDGFVVAWTRRSSDAQAGVYYQLLQRDGTAVGEAVQVGSLRDAIEPSVGASADGSFVIAWMAPHAQGYSVQSQRFAADGEPMSAPRTLATPEEGWLSGAAVATALDGRHLVAFNRDHGGERGEELVCLQFDAEGQLVAQGAGSAAREGRQALHPGAGARRAVWSTADAFVLAWDGDAGLGDASAAHLSYLPARALQQGEAQLLAQASLQAEPALFDVAAHDQAAIPPIWDPNWVPQDRLLFPAAAAGDFGFEAVPGTGWTPPDPEMAVGPDRIGVMTNGRIAMFDKAGNEQWRDEIENSFGFWGSLGATGFVFDPEICWDPHDQRFVAMACERSNTGTSEFLLAVSKDATPDNANDWHKYRINVTSTAGNDIDSPNLSVSRGYLLLTADFFGPDKYLLHIIDKSSIYSGGSPVFTEELITGTSQQSMGIPVVYDDTDTLYIVQSTEFSNNDEIILHAVQDPFTSYSRTTHTLNVNNYTYPNQPPQKGSSSRPFLFEPRFWSVAQRNGKIWAVHHVNNSRARVKWYEFDLQGWPTSGSNPSVRQFGTINLEGEIHTFFPSIHVDAQDNVAVTFARSAPNEYISIGRATRGAGDPLGTMRPAQVVQLSQNAHTSGRWGDYSGTQADPTTPGVFWGHHEFTNGSTGSWRTWVARYDLRPAGLVLQEDPISAGASNTLTVSGATPGARVFFVYSTLGTELTEVAPLSVTLSLQSPTLVGAATANASGDASVSRSVPASAAGLTVWLQAAEFGESSNWYSTVIQ
ncbi:MAG: hypothetical protein CMJ94_08505 [Planctomycetes bacterium]|nr:hypothetical protein [Planctomycetota bacterium]